MFKKLFGIGKKRNRGIGRADGGATAIEFAMIGGPFLFMLFSIAETGAMLFTEYALQASVQEAARLVRTGQAQGSTMSASSFKAKICQYAVVIPNCNSKITVYMKSATKFSTLTMPSYLNVGLKDDGTANPTSYGCGAAGDAIGIIATYDWKFVVPNLLPVLNRKDTTTQHYLGNVQAGKARRLSGVAVFRNEPFPAGSACGA